MSSKTTRSNVAAAFRTGLLMAFLMGLFVVIGALIGGPRTALTFLIIGAVMNLGAYWFSDKIALKMARARPLGEDEAPGLHRMVSELAAKADLPKPSLHIIEEKQPNAFATGRGPKNSAVAVTAGIVELLPEDQLRGVIAHELAHIRNRDILIQSVAATIGGAITYLGYMLLWFGGDDESPLGLFGALALTLLAPIAASLIQLAISRQREYSADATGAEICGKPEALAGALENLDRGAQAIPMKVNESAEPMYIVKPFRSGAMSHLFSTHPPTEERVRRLREMAAA